MNNNLRPRLHQHFRFFLLTILVGFVANAAHAAPVQLRSMTLGKGYNGDIVGPTRKFSPRDRTFHAVVKLDRISSGDRVKVVWIMLNAGGVRNYRLLQKEMRTQRMNQLHFSVSLPRDWPRGDYRADVYINNRIAGKTHFAVR